MCTLQGCIVSVRPEKCLSPAQQAGGFRYSKCGLCLVFPVTIDEWNLPVNYEVETFRRQLARHTAFYEGILNGPLTYSPNSGIGSLTHKN